MFSNVKCAHLGRNLKQNIMKRIHQNHPKEGVFLKNSGGHAPQTLLALCARQGEWRFLCNS